MSQDSRLSPQWHRIESLRPELRRHVKAHRHFYRGDLWYVLQDLVSGRIHRYSPDIHYIVGLMNGERTMAELWSAACERFGDDVPSQGEILVLLSQLHAADLIATDRVPDIDELSSRGETRDRQSARARWKNPLALRFRLLDPNRALNAMRPVFAPLLGKVGALLWIAVITSGAVVVATHWPELTLNATDRLLSLENIVLLFLIYPFVKALHEFGHGIIAKHYGAEVHEMGVMLLVLLPIPYVDASATSTFPSHRQRMLVGAAGMMIELFIAAVAALVWVSAEPGVVRVLCYNTIFVAGVSTLLFNANPLLRYDGYYILMDWLQMPNLGSRANRMIGYLLQGRVFGNEQAKSPANSKSEAVWLSVYAISAFIYRLFVTFLIAIFVGTQYFVVGVVLALWAVFTMLLLPAAKKIVYLVSDPALDEVRSRAIATTASVLLMLVMFTSLVPLPSWSNAQGVVRVPDDAWIRAEVGGNVERVLVAPNALVEVGQPVVVLKDPVRRARLALTEARLADARARYDAARPTDRVAASNIRGELIHWTEQVRDAREQVDALTVRAPEAGTLIYPGAVTDLPDRFFGRGELIAYVIQADVRNVRAVVGLEDVARVRSDLSQVEARLASAVPEIVSASLVAEVPGATTEFPSLALSLEGGGEFAAEEGGDQVRALQPFYQFDVRLEQIPDAAYVGQRVYLRFAHSYETLMTRWWRGLRQLFLEHFSV